MAGARGIEPRSRVLETLILTVVLCPFEVSTRVILRYFNCFVTAQLFINLVKSVIQWCNEQNTLDSTNTHHALWLSRLGQNLFWEAIGK